MLEPLSDKERVSIAILTLIDPETATANERQVHEWIGSYEATVKNRDERIAALEAAPARWAPVIEAAIEARRAQHRYNTAIPFTDDREEAARRAYEANRQLEARIDAALKEDDADG